MLDCMLYFSFNIIQPIFKNLESYNLIHLMSGGFNNLVFLFYIKQFDIFILAYISLRGECFVVSGQY